MLGRKGKGERVGVCVSVTREGLRGGEKKVKLLRDKLAKCECVWGRARIELRERERKRGEKK